MFAEGTLLHAVAIKGIVPTLVGAGAAYVSKTARSYPVRTPAAVITALAAGALFGLVICYTDVRNDSKIEKQSKVKAFKDDVNSYMVYWAEKFSTLATIYLLYQMALNLEAHRLESMGVENATNCLVKMVQKHDGWYVRLPSTN